MSDNNRNTINPIAIGFAVAVGATAAYLANEDNRNKARDWVKDMADKVTDMMSTAGKKTNEKIEDVKDIAADKMSKAADKMQETSNKMKQARIKNQEE